MLAMRQCLQQLNGNRHGRQQICNHTPLHRQSVILERDIGLEISRATLSRLSHLSHRSSAFLGVLSPTRIATRRYDQCRYGRSTPPFCPPITARLSGAMDPKLGGVLEKNSGQSEC